MRYIIGIDLGTTNTCASYVDTHDDRLAIRLFPLPQLVGPGKTEARALLPSYCYIANKEEWPPTSISMPWAKDRDYFVGDFALDYGSRVPTRLVCNAKSWLCHSAAARRDPILPAGGDLDKRISPVEASTRYLKHIADAWNWTIAKGEHELAFDQQEVVLTVPASFDEVARALTAEAAKKAGFGSVTMLEEPQAAFYNWIDQHQGNWSEILQAGDRILVCDVGGGTTDFSIIDVRKIEDSTLSFQRMAVGDHLLLGGENIDNAIAHLVSERLSVELSASQWLQLCHQARTAKEAIYGKGESFFRFILTGSGSRVVAGTTGTTLQKEEIDDVVINGFFGVLPWEEARLRKSAGGIRSIGLPFEEDPSITRHLAYFLDSHGCTNAGSPTHILFNGGTMLPSIFQRSILTSIETWFPGKGLKTLTAPHFDHAVARGAAYYGKVRRGLGVRIKGGSPRSYYLGIDVKRGNVLKHEAITLLPRGAEEGATYTAEHIFQTLPNQPVSFQLFTSHTRLHDKQGDFVSIDPEEMHALPPIHTVLRFGKTVVDDARVIPVRLSLSLTAIGTLELWLKSTLTDHTWSLEFQLRSATGQDDAIRSIGSQRKDETFDAAYTAAAEALIAEAFTSGGGISPKSLMEKLEVTLGMNRKEWPPSVLRSLWPPLLKHAAQRSLSGEHAERWWNLVGFVLRPGFGYPLDDFRLKDLWKIILAELNKNRSSELLQQQLICFRRIAAGLSRGQQVQIASEILPQIFTQKGLIAGKPPHLYVERLRTLASLELMEVPTKIKLGQAIIDKIIKDNAAAIEFWALGRIGARHLLHGIPGYTVPNTVCADWIEKILAHTHKYDQEIVARLFSQIARLTGHRSIDLSDALRKKICQTLPSQQLEEILLTMRPVSGKEQELAFGEALPPGLSLELADPNPQK